MRRPRRPAGTRDFIILIRGPRAASGLRTRGVARASPQNFRPQLALSRREGDELLFPVVWTMTTSRVNPSTVDLPRTESDRGKSKLTLCFFDFTALAPPTSSPEPLQPLTWGCGRPWLRSRDLSALGGPCITPSTSKLVLMSATTCLSLLAYSPLVSNQGLLGTVAAKRRRIQETAVSCKRTSCMCPG